MRETGAALSGIFYRINLAKPDTDVILLGLAAEVHTDRDGAIGLLVRKSLYPSELANLDDIGKEQLAKPAEYLIKVMEKAIENHNSKKVLDELAKKHEWALSFTAPIRIEVPEHYADGDATERVFGALHRLLEEGPGPKLLEIHPLVKQKIAVNRNDFRLDLLAA